MEKTAYRCIQYSFHGNNKVSRGLYHEDFALDLYGLIAG